MMSNTHPFEIPGHITLSEGNGGLPKLTATTPWSSSEIYLHGAHVTHFQKNGEPPLLFMSGSSAFAREKPIRGGVPIIFPWFGGREGFPAHGYARTTEWNLTDSSVGLDQTVKLHFQLPAVDPLEATFIVTVGETLVMELVVRNSGVDSASFESCLHTYCQIGSIETASVHGLTGCTYLDKVLTGEHTETPDAIRISGDVDRVYFDTSAPVEIQDPTLGRRILVAKSGSDSTVVWNPWIEKAKAMGDFGNDEYLRMVCVESGNVGKNRITLPPGGTSVLKVEVSSRALD